MATILYVDGMNFIEKVKEVLRESGIEKPVIEKYNFAGLLDKVLKGHEQDERHFYLAKLKEHPDTKEKSQSMILQRRELKLSLETQGFIVVQKGVVRGNYIKSQNGKDILSFKEKGVDVGIAVDMVTHAYEDKLSKAILASSDSDLQPAVAAIKNKQLSIIYLGFECNPNKGLTHTTGQAILIRNSEVLEFNQTLL